jgi:hypothetical protein
LKVSVGPKGLCLLRSLLLLELLAGASTCRAGAAVVDPLGVPAIELRDPLLANRPAFAFGWEFSLSQASAIQALGVYDHDGDGLAGRFEAGIYDSVGRLLAQTVIEGQGEGIAAGFTWRTIPRLELAAGSYVVAAAGIWADGDRIPYNADQFQTAAGVTYLRPRFQPGVTSLGAPLDAFPAGISVQGYWAASFAMAAVPGTGPVVGPTLPDDHDHDHEDDHEDDGDDDDHSEREGDDAQSPSEPNSSGPTPRDTPGPLGLLGLGEALRRSRMLQRRLAHRHLQAGGLQHHTGTGAQAPALQAEIGGLSACLGQQRLELDRETGR